MYTYTKREVWLSLDQSGWEENPHSIFVGSGSLEITLYHTSDFKRKTQNHPKNQKPKQTPCFGY